jgi:hypothetical protein
MKFVSKSWPRTVDAIIRGDARDLRFVRLGPTPALLRSFGLAPADLTISAAKIAKIRREHPEVSLAIWYDLPQLLMDPDAVFPSIHDDGSIIVLIAVIDADGNPVIVPVTASANGSSNVVLSVYGKQGTARQSGIEWIARQISAAKLENKRVYEKNGSADSKPKPGSAEAIPWSPDLIPVDRSTEPKRAILKLGAKVKPNG